MMCELDPSAVVFRFDRTLPPRLKVRSGDEVRIQTHDARSGRLRRPADVHKTAPAPGDAFPRTNPATGPIWVEGCQPGDTLAVTILAVDLDPVGFIIARPEWGTARGMTPELVAKLLPVENGFIHFDQLRLPIRPNIGVLATAPADGPISTLQMGRFGGNMDCNAIRVGTTVYLPVFVPGALLFVGDVHAAMGDAEPVGTGCEIGASVTVRVTRVVGEARNWPWLETADHLIGYGSGPNFETAADYAVREAVEIVAARTGLPAVDAFMLIGLIGDVRVNQACNAPIDVGVRIEVQKAGLPTMGQRFHQKA